MAVDVTAQQTGVRWRRDERGRGKGCHKGRDDIGQVVFPIFWSLARRENRACQHKIKYVARLGPL